MRTLILVLCGLEQDDFTVDCTTSSFYSAVVLAVVLIAAVPIGVPLCFLWLMARAKSALPDGKVNTTVLGGSKLCSDELDDDQDRYGFLCRDLKPEHWYVYHLSGLLVLSLHSLK